ncbi:hypothetical protein HYS29_00070 [Candidatus Microgenomates bacterium]|nr:hypothetical protein [Candidatus Microgenomates bacterium]MBI2622128.1 hypothetical protein [Candidatus Microgenomates bacterium]
MDRSGILGGFLDEVEGAVKGGVKSGFQQTTGTGEFAPPKTAPVQGKGEAKTGNVDIGAMRTEEEQEKARNLAVQRQKLAEMMAPPRTQELRPQERVARQTQQELEQKEAKKLPPVVQRAQRKTENRGGSG